MWGARHAAQCRARRCWHRAWHAAALAQQPGSLCASHWPRARSGDLTLTETMTVNQEFFDTNPPVPSGDAPDGHFYFIVCGAGTAGSVVAPAARGTRGSSTAIASRMRAVSAGSHRSRSSEATPSARTGCSSVDPFARPRRHERSRQETRSYLLTDPQIFYALNDWIGAMKPETLLSCCLPQERPFTPRPWLMVE